jgi:hypothetical protein
VTAPVRLFRDAAGTLVVSWPCCRPAARVLPGGGTQLLHRARCPRRDPLTVRGAFDLQGDLAPAAAPDRAGPSAAGPFSPGAGWCRRDAAPGRSVPG